MSVRVGSDKRLANIETLVVFLYMSLTSAASFPFFPFSWEGVFFFFFLGFAAPE